MRKRTKRSPITLCCRYSRAHDAQIWWPCDGIRFPLCKKCGIIPHTKNNEAIIIPLTEDAIKILKKRQEYGSEFVFPGDGDLGHIIEPRRAWRRILKRAGILDLRLHDSRRTLGSWEAMTGSSTIIIGKSLGHKSQQATAVYARLNLDPVRKSLEKATKAMSKAAKTKLINQ